MPLSGCRILVVEDEAQIALDLEHTLRELHAVVIGPVDNIADARRFIAAGRIDCAVLDVTTWKAWPVILKPMATGDLLRAIEQVVVSRAREP
jgi:DNA-binding NtrC family response regulator